MLLRGMGHYTDDVSLPGQAYMVMVRSSIAHGTIRAIDMDAARKMPGVLAVYSSAELERLRHAQMRRRVEQSRRHAAAQTAPRSARDRQGALCRRPGRLRRRRNRRCRRRTRPKRSQSISSRCRFSHRPKPPPGRRAADLRRRPEQCRARLPLRRQPRRSKPLSRRAAHVTRVAASSIAASPSIRWSRARRSAEYKDNRFTLHVCSQGVFGMRANLADALGVDVKDVRVLTGPGRRFVRHEGRWCFRNTSACCMPRARSAGR